MITYITNAKNKSVQSVLVIRLIIIFLVFLTVIIIDAKNVYAATSVYNRTIRTGQEINIEGEPYTFRIQPPKYISQINGKYIDLILNEEDCKTVGYYTFCLGSIDHSEILEYADIRLSVTKANCSSYFDWNFTKKCKSNIGGYCVEDEGCISNDCHHGICTFKRPICGDGFCDQNEKCSGECNITVTLQGDAKRSTIDSTKDWQKINYILKKGKRYEISYSNSFKLNQSGALLNNSPEFYENQTNCDGVAFGKPIIDVCGKCMDLTELTEITSKTDCQPSLMVNDYLLVDNSGSFDVIITDPDAIIPQENNNLSSENLTENNSNNNTTINLGENESISNISSISNASPQNVSTNVTITTVTTNSSKREINSDEPQELSNKNNLLKVVLAVTGAIILFSIIFAIILKKKESKEDEVW